jgi:hypothetical protein
VRAGVSGGCAVGDEVERDALGHQGEHGFVGGGWHELDLLLEPVAGQVLGDLAHQLVDRARIASWLGSPMRQ